MSCQECKKEFINTYEYISINFPDRNNNMQEKKYHLSCFMDKMINVTSSETKIDVSATLNINTRKQVYAFFEYEVFDKPVPVVCDSIPC